MQLVSLSQVYSILKQKRTTFCPQNEHHSAIIHARKYLHKYLKQKGKRESVFEKKKDAKQTGKKK